MTTKTKNLAVLRLLIRSKPVKYLFLAERQATMSMSKDCSLHDTPSVVAGPCTDRPMLMGELLKESCAFLAKADSKPPWISFLAYDYFIALNIMNLFTFPM